MAISTTLRNTEKMFSISVKERCGRKRGSAKQITRNGIKGKIRCCDKRIFADISVNFE